DRLSANARWDVGYVKIGNTFARQAIGMVWDFAEANPFSGATGDFDGAIQWVAEVCDHGSRSSLRSGHAEQRSATTHALPDDSVSALITDPPYYDAVPYSFLSDFFYVWLHRSIGPVHPSLLRDVQVPKDAEIVVDRPHELSTSTHDIHYYEEA